ncbi:nitrile hydratase subunit beta [Acidisoma cellulosilytica]|uniref:Nitrile hydratase subunit beta n=1 Tax=Acidisoma cellulosilyticum TaxID=2802395 RepID=A0A964E482_9PROT|nr:nitrile hydratase subunit beta [Acidisoma cellulosilyticum]MCB8881012.1 nitrile hydratase subunit beta [Acidisoma cellulosilyticum]
MMKAGQRVLVRNDWPETRGPCHIRTPHYLRGATGTVLRHLGDFPNPEDLAFGRHAKHLALYHVSFDASSLWGDRKPQAEILVELYESWLEPV